MSASKIQISIFLIILSFVGCFDPPEFSDKPQIEFKSLKYVSYDNDADSLLLKFYFEDGDGDIGLNGNEGYYPYHSFNYIIDSRDSIVRWNDSDVQLPLYTINVSNKREFFSEVDNRPAYSCSDYRIMIPEVIKDEELPVIVGGQDITWDTVYIQHNEYRYNFYIDFLKRKNGVYSKIIFSEIGCSLTFNARFPVFDNEYDGQALSGDITYAMNSIGFPILLTPDTFKIRFFIYDRALNKSNVVESPELLFQDIIAN